MTARKQLQDLANLRLPEAKALYTAGFDEGCTYLCGNVVEFALKAHICATLDIDEYSEKGKLGDHFKTHGFVELRVLSGTEKGLAVANRPLGDNWALAASWKTWPKVRACRNI